MSPKKNNGIALFSVLLVTLSLATISSYFLYISKQNLELIERIENRVLAELEADSQLAKLKLDLLKNTFNTISTDIDLVDETKSTFNYYGDPFEYAEGVTVTITDNASFIKLMPLNTYLLKSWLESKGLSPGDVSEKMECLADWTDWNDLKSLNGGESSDYLLAGNVPPRNGQIQSVSELGLICGWDSELVASLSSLVTLFSSDQFHPTMADPELIDAHFQSEITLERLVELRQKGNPITIRKYLPKGEQYGVQYSLSNTVKIELQALVGNSLAKRSLVFDMDFKYKSEPPFNDWYWVPK